MHGIREAFLNSLPHPLSTLARVSESPSQVEGTSKVEKGREMISW